ncbi:uncharacterized protein F4812DRAFT_438467 [Daldinia caldariorum]|uniref:uncharacterized protein n=1 Tax=Daldinia caldariorum TaxID=326644 RepID=UPI0020083B43|nr:uncharacterized protein F4812DRAFT_438467 [Daldinia caldariorum]KAI1465374.1 hypothetical protein F4812DRAFT_438467 [Daldinia caldariorum]
MSFGTTLLSKLGLSESGMSPLLPLHTSPPPRRVEEHDLHQLSPRPDGALLSPDFTREFAYRDSISDIPNGSRADATNMNSPPTRSKGKGKAIAFAYQGHSQYARSRTPTFTDGLSEPMGHDLKVPPGIWRPNIRTEPRDNRHTITNTHTSFVESIFKGRPDRSSDRTVQSDVDNTFKMLQRRERQLQKELQKLLDAQGTALERDLQGNEIGNTSPEDTKQGLSPDLTASSIQRTLSEGSVVPVRQPKNKPMSKRQARIGIARSVTMLADLKNEEDAYIASALAERKAALSKLRNLSSQRKSITAEMKALEEDSETSIETEIATIESQHRTVCASIEKLEEKLRILRRTKAELERKLEEARSTREASLSGYKGALKQCDQSISKLMKYPGVQVLEVEDLREQGGEDLTALTSKHMSGVEFLSLRPERRTIEMAKDWWEGEVAVLERRKATVDKERVALEEGSEIWQQVLTMLIDFETRLNQSLQDATKQQDNMESGDPASILRDQYRALNGTLREVQRLYDYVESRGWNLLIAAIGAELAHFEGLKDFLAEIIRSSGYDNGVITPTTSVSGGGGRRRDDDDDLIGMRENGTSGLQPRSSMKPVEVEDDDEQEELTHSVVRRWDNSDAQHAQQLGPPPYLLPGASHRDESDNEVPPGLLSEDESHNDVPAEFLSMHSPPQTRVTKDAPPNRSRLRRESSEVEDEDDNRIPPDLLSETRREDDGVD